MSETQHTAPSGSATETPAQAYERYFVPAIFIPWSQVALHAAPMPGERVLDLACGTGIVARTVAPLVGASGRVVAQDISPAMLSVASSLPQPPGAPIEWQEGSADAEIFPEASFDLMTCQQGLQFFPDRPAALAQMRRVLVPGGRLVFAVWRSIEHNPVHAAVNVSMERRLGAAAATSRGFSLGDADALRALLECGFPGRCHRARRQDRPVPLARRLRAGEPARGHRGVPGTGEAGRRGPDCARGGHPG